jgi:hypothetical protein
METKHFFLKLMFVKKKQFWFSEEKKIDAFYKGKKNIFCVCICAKSANDKKNNNFETQKQTIFIVNKMFMFVWDSFVALNLLFIDNCNSFTTYNLYKRIQYFICTSLLNMSTLNRKHFISHMSDCKMCSKIVLLWRKKNFPVLDLMQECK